MNPKARQARERQLAYAKEREAIHLQWITSADRNLNREINELMRYVGETLRTESQSWLVKYADAEGISLSEASKRASTADIRALERKAKQYVRDLEFSHIANKEMKEYNFSMKMSRHELLRRTFDLELEKGFIKVDGLIYNHLQMMGLEELKRQAGLLGMIVTDRSTMEMKAKLIANSSFHGTTFSNRIWENQDQLRKILDQGIKRSIMVGKHPTAWMNEMSKYLDRGLAGSSYALKRLAVTESTRVQIAAQREIYELNGVNKYMVVCEPTACEICMPFDGVPVQVYDMREGDNAPPFHPNCKCSTAAYSEPPAIENHAFNEQAYGESEELYILRENREKELMNITDHDQFDSYLKSKYDIDIDPQFRTLNIESVKEAFKGFESGFDEFPEVKELFKSIKVSDHGLMGYGANGELHFNAEEFRKGIKLFEETVLETTGFWIKNASVESMGMHEFAHMLEHQLVIINKPTDRGRILSPSAALNGMIESGSVVLDAHTQFINESFKKNPNFEYKSMHDTLKEISGYAGTTHQEGMAEAYADVRVNGSNAHPFSKMIVDQLKKELLK